MSQINDTLKACLYLIEKHALTPSFGSTRGKPKVGARSGMTCHRATKAEIIKIKAMRRKGHTLREIATAHNNSEYQVSTKSKRSK